MREGVQVYHTGDKNVALGCHAKRNANAHLFQDVSMLFSVRVRAKECVFESERVSM